ncbi:MAG TPA: hypothetical protein VGH76_26250 [Actinomycetospora sp.]
MRQPSTPAPPTAARRPTFPASSAAAHAPSNDPTFMIIVKSRLCEIE